MILSCNGILPLMSRDFLRQVPRLVPRLVMRAVQRALTMRASRTVLKPVAKLEFRRELKLVLEPKLEPVLKLKSVCCWWVATGSWSVGTSLPLYLGRFLTKIPEFY